MKLSRRHVRKNPLPPRTTLGAVTVGAAAVALASGVGAGLGAVIQPSQQGAAAIGSVGGALAAGAIGLGSALVSKRWRSSGLAAAGVAGVLLLLLRKGGV